MIYCIELKNQDFFNKLKTISLTKNAAYVHGPIFNLVYFKIKFKIFFKFYQRFNILIIVRCLKIDKSLNLV